MRHSAGNRIVRALLRAPAQLYRLGLGPLFGKRFVLLTHIGRRSGFRHRTMLEVIEYRSEGPEIVVMSGFGRSADWLRNIEENGKVQLAIGSMRFSAKYRFLGEKEAEGVFEGYERKNRFIAPIIRWVLSRLVGWKYRGTKEDRRRLVTQLPLVAFMLTQTET
jgi:deazaflavin-dependent oxidoreductase (nitroreductase family)